MRPDNGFSLIELAIVLVIVGFLSSSLLGSLQARQRIGDDQRIAERLQEIVDSLYGFAATQGRLPCPAPPQLASDIAEAGFEDCRLEHGVMPWRTLNLRELDPWGQRFTYYARASFTALPTTGALAGFTLDSTGNAVVRPSASAGNKLADSLPCVVVSHGPNGLGGYRASGQRSPAGDPDEAENADADLSFVDRLPDDSYDDRLSWPIPSVLKLRLIEAGRLP